MKIFALIGRPNVGKSTLFNRLARRRIAIVDPAPGVTRDKNTAVIDYKGFSFVLFDTGGFEPDMKETVPAKMREHAQLAIEEADGIVFMLDKIAGWTPQDQLLYDYLRKSAKPVYFVVNKVDGPTHEAQAMEFFESGVDEVWPISSAHGYGVGALLERMAIDFPQIIEKSDAEEEEGIISLAVVGRPNAGKSSIVNRLLGEDRQIVHNEPGTTRDPVDHHLIHYGQKIRLVDTAGIKKKSRVSQLIDRYSMVAALKSIERSDVAILVIDATSGVVEQDARIAGHVLDRGKALILAINKWDLVTEKTSTSLEKMREEIYDTLKFANFAPIEFVSALSGQRVFKLVEQAKEVYGQYSRRIQTSDLNRIIQNVTARHTPPSKGGRRNKIFFGTQVKSKPPTFVISATDPKAINLSYQRFIANQFRYHFGLEGTPIRIFWRDKSMKPVQ